MRNSARKFVGTILLVIFVVTYVLAVTAVGGGRIAEASAVTQLIYFLLAGLLWVYPAGLLIRWMQKPNPATEPRSGVKRR
jgi:cbb3-type cytochrome oxidase subunit 3